MTIEFFLAVIVIELACMLGVELYCRTRPTTTLSAAPPDSPTVIEVVDPEGEPAVVQPDPAPPVPATPAAPRIGHVHDVRTLHRRDAERLHYVHREYDPTGVWVREGTPAWDAAMNDSSKVIHVNGVPEGKAV